MTAYLTSYIQSISTVYDLFHRKDTKSSSYVSSFVLIAGGWFNIYPKYD